MKRIISSLGLIASLCAAGAAQKTISTSGSAKQDTSAQVGKAAAAGVSGQLQHSLSVKSARVGDQIVLKASQAVKHNGRVLVDKGSTIFGRVTNVQRRVGGKGASAIGVTFDRIQKGSEVVPISAVITSVVSAKSSVAAGDDSVMMSSSAQTSSTARPGNGGLLGGVTSTVGSVISATGETVGGITSTVGQGVGPTTGVRGLIISKPASASATGGSTLTVSGADLKLEKGTIFNLNVITR
jgi:hypothetical protein